MPTLPAPPSSGAPTEDPLGSPSYHVPLRHSGYRLQGLPLLDEAQSLTLSRVSMTTEEYLRSDDVGARNHQNGWMYNKGGNGGMIAITQPNHQYHREGGYGENCRHPHQSGAAPNQRNANGGVGAMPLRPFAVNQYLAGADRHSVNGSGRYTDDCGSRYDHSSGKVIGNGVVHNTVGPDGRIIAARGGVDDASHRPTLTLDRDLHDAHPFTQYTGIVDYKHTAAARDAPPYHAASLQHMRGHAHYALWREKVPFICPIRNPELMSYDPLLINSKVLGLTRDVGMRNTAGLLEGSSDAHRLADGDAFTLGIDRGVTGMSLRKHSTAYRMSHHTTYPGMMGASSSTGDGGQQHVTSAERFLDPYVSGHAMGSDTIVGWGDSGNGSPAGYTFGIGGRLGFGGSGSAAGDDAPPPSRAAVMRSMGISGFASPKRGDTQRRAMSANAASTSGSSGSSSGGNGGARKGRIVLPPPPASSSATTSSRTWTSSARGSSSSNNKSSNTATTSSSSSKTTSTNSSSNRLHSAHAIDYLKQQKEDAVRRMNNTSLAGAIGDTFGRMGNATTASSLSETCAPDPTPFPLAAHSANWHWVDVDPASRYLVAASQSR